MPELEPHPIYDMYLHERYNVDTNIDILRVPGGWLYVAAEVVSIETAASMGVLVPLDNEFQYENNTPSPPSP